MNGLHFFFGVGAFLAPLIVAQLMLLTGGIRGPFWLLALLILPAIIWLARLPSPAAPAGSTGNRARPVSRLALALFILFFFLYVGLEVSYSGWIYTYALEMGLAGQATAAYLTSAFWGAITLGRLLNVALAIRFNPQAILYTDLGGAVLCTGLMVAWPGSATALWLGTIGLGLCLASVFSAAMALAERRMPITGRTTGLFLVGASLGAMCLPWLVGQLFEPVGPPVLMMTIIATLLITLGVLIGLDRFSTYPKEEDRKDLKGVPHHL
jgi:FHS family Na+ dependent glucose MFS transporter 1